MHTTRYRTYVCSDKNNKRVLQKLFSVVTKTNTCHSDSSPKFTASAVTTGADVATSKNSPQIAAALPNTISN